MASITLVEAINLALRHEMSRDPDVVVLGQDVGVDGGVFRATLGLTEQFGPGRVIDTPLAEALIAGMAIGMAVEGLKPVAEIQFSGFAYTVIDQVINHAGRMRHRTRGRLACPMVLRTPCGAGIHAPEHHSESPEAMFAHIPGLRVVYPSTPRRAYGLLLAAIRDPDPVIFLEPTRLYRLFKEEVADDGQAVQLDVCHTAREGTDVTLVAWGPMMPATLAAADDLAEQGVAAEVLDVSTLKPLDMDSILASVARTGRCVIASEEARTASFAGEIAANLAEDGLLTLLAPVQRVTAPDIVVPFSRLEQQYMPGKDAITAAARRILEYS